MQEILQSNLTNLDFVRNSAGFMLQKIGPNWINNIGDWVNTQGYLFKMSLADDLTIAGEAIDPQTPLELSTGYQIIGYLPDYLLNAEEVFEDVLENLEFVRNTAGLMFQKIGPNWVNSIGYIQPGEGYLVKMTADDILVYKEWECGNPIIDERDEQVYNTVLIGGQCWMAENLNIGTMINGIEEMTDNGVIEKYCYDNNTANCDDYGGLYQWNEIMEYTTIRGVQGICPEEWHVPTDDEWKILEGTVDSQYPVGDPIWDNTGWRGYDVGLNLKSTSGWLTNNGYDIYGFTALPGGHNHSDGTFLYLTSHAYFWPSSEDNTNFAWRRSLVNSAIDIARYIQLKSQSLSIRCLKD